MQRIELIDEKVFPFHIVHFGEFIKFGIYLLMQILDQLSVHHAFGEELLIELFLREFLLL